MVFNEIVSPCGSHLSCTDLLSIISFVVATSFW
jgi:hypothetical protein